MNELTFLGLPVFDSDSLIELGARFLLNLLVVGIIVHRLYYQHGKRTEYYFTFTLISLSIFFLTYLLGGMKIKTGLVLGLFAVFGIIRYRTETMGAREMTYLFSIITISVINALGTSFPLVELLLTNLIFILIIWCSEYIVHRKHISTKYVRYDRIELIVPERQEELKADLEKRLGLRIVRIETGAVDFLKDSVMLKIHYDNGGNPYNSADHLMKMPK